MRTQKLTVREEQILSLIEAGKRYKVIAVICGITKGTVTMHVRNIRVKLDARPEIKTALIRKQSPEAHA